MWNDSKIYSLKIYKQWQIFKYSSEAKVENKEFFKIHSDHKKTIKCPTSLANKTYFSIIEWNKETKLLLSNFKGALKCTIHSFERCFTKNCILDPTDNTPENNQVLCEMQTALTDTYRYAGPSAEHFYHKCRRTATGMFLESQSKTPLQNKDWKERFEVKIENTLCNLYRTWTSKSCILQLSQPLALRTTLSCHQRCPKPFQYKNTQ